MKSFKQMREQSNEPITYDTKLVDGIADLLHQQWIDWSKGIIKKGEISQETQDRWARECFMSFDKLSPHMQELDRVFARRLVNYLQINGYDTGK